MDQCKWEAGNTSRHNTSTSFREMKSGFKLGDFEGQPLHGQWKWKQKLTAKEDSENFHEGAPSLLEFKRLLTFTLSLDCE